ncbi:MAG: SEC-C metal-binding domain-containing protein [Thermodesulfovibrionales bacterium]|nr:SEC-C metal-binding domain-containing protein [Thermodesulfovibrionales bacterium]
MEIPFDKYCGDAMMEEYLKKGGSKLSLSEIYGLLYGTLAAPNMVMPSQITSMIFSKEGGDFESMEEVKEIMGNLMSLWNIIAGWKPESEPFFYPDIKYPDTSEGLKQRIKDNSSLFIYFIKGLDIGGTIEDDFSEDGLNALETLSKANALLLKYAELFEMKEAEEGKELEKTSDSINQLEGVVADCIARINLGLKEARIRVAEEMRMFADAQKKALQARSTKIKRNDPCPCGSGKKYKKCCGLIH